MASPSLSPSSAAAVNETTDATAGDQSPSPSPSPLTLPPPSAAAPATSSRRLPPPCWTHEETLALIEAYRDKWLGLRRGNLRAADWQDVADTVASRCPEASPAKTPVQCRHKIEKLRKRFRAERTRSLSHQNRRPPSWPYYGMLDAMEISGPNPIPAPKIPALPSSSSSDEEDEDERRNTRSIHGLMANGGGGGAGLRFNIPKASRSKIPNPSPNPSRFLKGYDHATAAAAARSPMEDMRQSIEKKRRIERENEEEREETEEGDVFGEMAAAIRTFGEGFLRVEKMKMEMAREMEKTRMEMELKRTEMVLETQRRIVDAFVKGFVGTKRAKGSPHD